MKASFQIVILIIFVVAAIFGVLVFSGAIPIGNNNQPGALGTVVIWGTERSDIISKPLEEINNSNSSFRINYVQKSADTFDHDLLEALASGTGPDMFFLPDDLIFHYAERIQYIPYTSFPLSTFKSNFTSAGEVFLAQDGELAYPLAIDPLMMYYNRSILDANAIIYPPATWDELSKLVPTLTKKDDSNKVLQSAVALGQFSNVNHAKDILAALFMQTGNPIVSTQGGILESALDKVGYNLAPVLDFYTSFADPARDVYSWNKSFANSRNVFSSENSAFYFGFASEINSLVNQNPNQNFFIAPFPQVPGAGFKLTSAHVIGLAVLSSSKNISTAFAAANLMATGEFASKFALSLGIAPARRDLLAKKPSDAYSPIFYDSAIYAKSWLDPSSAETDNIFRRMIEGVLSNSVSAQNAIKDASARMNILLR